MWGSRHASPAENTASLSRDPRRRNRRYACDFCRKRKTKCDGSPGMRTGGRGLEVCTSCTIFGVDCTFGSIGGQRCVPKEYIESLEQRQLKLQWLLEKLFPLTDFVTEVGPYIPHWMSDTRSPKPLRPSLSLGCNDSALGSKPFGLKVKMWPPFPPIDLFQCLVNTYFSRVNVVWPLLHRPTFEADLLKERHRRDLGFASVVLAACAVASRYCHDRRVLAKVRSTPDLPSATSDTTPMHPWDGPHPWTDDLEQGFAEEPIFEAAPLYSAGWKYFDRMQRCQVFTTDQLSLCELQTAHLTHQFLVGLSEPCAGWVMIGAAIRKAQAVSLHRKQTYTLDSLESELWKRAFWCLVVSDRLAGAECGRPSYSRDEDIDVGLPLEIDDEFWSPPDENSNSTPLGQPENQPSIITSFNVYARLSLIYDWVIRALYAVNKSIPPKTGAAERDIVILTELSKALDEWKESIPPHLNWDCEPPWKPHATRVRVMYHQLQMHLYQGFILDKNAAISATSLGSVESAGGCPSYQISDPIIALCICVQAVVSNTCVLEANLHQFKHNTDFVFMDAPALLRAATITGLMIITIGIQRHIPGFLASADVLSEEEIYLNVCIEYLTAFQDRWILARYGIALLASAIEMAVTLSSEPPSTLDTPVEPEPLPLESEAIPDFQAVQSTTEHVARPKTHLEAHSFLGSVSTSSWPYGNEWVFQNAISAAPPTQDCENQEDPKHSSSWDPTDSSPSSSWGLVQAFTGMTATPQEPIQCDPQPSVGQSHESRQPWDLPVMYADNNQAGSWQTGRSSSQRPATI